MADAGILSIGGTATQLTIGEEVYSGSVYSSLAEALAAEGTVAVDAGSYTATGYKVSGTTKTIISKKGAIFTGGNDTTEGGGAFKIGSGATLNIDGGTFANNEYTGAEAANQGGGAIFSKGNLIINDALFDANHASSYGGAIYTINNSTLEITNTVFTNNTAKSGKPAAAVYSASKGAVISGSTFFHNYSAVASSNAGAVYSAADITIQANGNRKTVFEGNTASSNGGALYLNAGTATVSDTIFKSNVATRGGAVKAYNANYFDIDGATFFENIASTCGAGIDLEVRDNKSVVLKITDTVFEKNYAKNATKGYGGALYLSGELSGSSLTTTLQGVTFSANTASVSGSALYHCANSETPNAILTIAGDGIVLDGNSVAGADGVAFYNGANATVDIKGKIVLKQASDTILNLGTMTIDGALFLPEDTLCAQVIDANFSSAWLTDGSNAVGTTEGYTTFMYGNDLYVTAAGNEFTAIDYVLVKTDLANGENYIIDNGGNKYTIGMGYNNLADAIADGTDEIVVSGEISGGSVVIYDADKVIRGLDSENKGIISGITTEYETSSENNGGGVFKITGGATVIRDIVFYDNHLNTVEEATGFWGGGVIFAQADLTLAGTTFTENSVSNRYGGAVYTNSGKLTISDSLFIGNYGAPGGAVHVGGAETATITGSTFTDNNAGISANAGALYIDKITTVGSVDKLTVFDSNSGRNGGAIYANNSTAGSQNQIINAYFVNNSASAEGGAVYVNTGYLTISGSTFATKKDSVYAKKGSITFTGENIVNTDISKSNSEESAKINLSNATFIVNNSNNIHWSELIFAENTTNAIIFNGSAQVNFTVAGGQSLSSANITVNGALFDNQAVTIATGIKDIGTVT
ncbi:MAG: hypothetical protein IKA71_09190, partial [Lentisphaeria bacterium]|nr:hypothetical protein [Lentisphaeria bacterium]